MLIIGISKFLIYSIPGTYEHCDVTAAKQRLHAPGMLYIGNPAALQCS